MIKKTKEIYDKVENPINPEIFDVIFNNSSDGIIILDSVGKIIDCNEAIGKIINCNKAIGTKITFYLENKDKKNVFDNIKKNNISKLVLNINSTKYNVDIFRLGNGNDNNSKFVLIFRDRKNSFEKSLELKHRINSLEIISEISSRFIHILDMDYIINQTLRDIGILSNSSRTYLFRFNNEVSIMSNTHEWCADGVEPQIQNLNEVPSSLIPWWVDKLKNRENIFITDVSNLPSEAKNTREILEEQDIKSLLVFPIYFGKKLSGFIGFDNIEKTGVWEKGDFLILRLTSELIGHAFEKKISEDIIKKSLAEKEFLLKEIHHRVKNNLQIISGILILQNYYFDDEKINRILNDCKNRIKTMALIHERLYQSDSFEKIEIIDFIQGIADNIFSSYIIRGKSINLTLDIDQIEIAIDLAIPCGLIINELLSNSIKYAFPKNKSGEIFISFKKKQIDKFELKVKDNGIGFPKDFQFNNTNSMGFELVKTLIEQLHASIEIRNHNGVCFIIDFVKKQEY